MSSLSKFICLVLLALPFSQRSQAQEKEINTLIDAWHLAAAEADFDSYFSKMADDAVFIGTDPTENWQLEAFKKFAKPFFDKGKAWSFKALERNVYLSSDQNIAWFDELLDTQMKICRGSGVLKKVNGQWKIAHYVLSIAVPNENVDQLIQIKENFDNKLINSLKQ
ncbi:nuclear transport factor 2 family protein [Zhouia amylolytica]|uniref:nuclear transport factor 2 family protein n=1 Tax=Zhouia amylolytica TaxID=376730 RepID=UPI0020CC301F|nr:nuclear transport factor 2 family protein [Zhouia amylolytica]MCQ0111811.1 nuclear transport factor 2 family protein [Zhouia amylolytica]